MIDQTSTTKNERINSEVHEEVAKVPEEGSGVGFSFASNPIIENTKPV